MKKYSVQWTNLAYTDLYQIVSYIKRDQPINAKKVWLRLKSSAKKLEHYPERGRVVPELRAYGVLFYRELILKPWRLIYKITDKKVWVMALIDGRRDVEDLLFERLIHRPNLD